jgi:hypothetical protein
VITGFQAKMACDDAGTGAAPGGASTRFVGLTTFDLPSLEVGTFDATELDQNDGGDPTPAADPFERMRPTGLIKLGATAAEIKYTKANYQRLVALAQLGAGGAEHTFVLTAPDDQTAGTPTVLTTTFKGFVSKVDKVKWEKGNASMIPFEVTVRQKPTHA